MKRLRLLEAALRSEENESQIYEKIAKRIVYSNRRHRHGEDNLAAASGTGNRTSKMMKASSAVVKGDYKIERMASVLASAMNLYSIRCRFAPAAVKSKVLSKYEYTMQLLTCTIPGESCVLELGVGSGAVAFVLERVLQDPTLHLGIDPFPDVFGEPGHFFTKRLLPRMSMRFAPGILSSRSCSNQTATTITTNQSIREGEEELEPCEVRKHSLQACEQTVGEKFTAIVADCRGAFPKIISENPVLLKNVQWILMKHDHGEEAAAELNEKFRANGFVRTVGMPTEGWGYNADRNVFFIEVWEKVVQTTNAMDRRNELLTAAETAADKLNFYSASAYEKPQMKNRASMNITKEIDKANERKEGLQVQTFQEQDDNFKLKHGATWNNVPASAGIR